jgi:hypothetical protein
MQLKTRAQIIGAASVKLAVIFRNQDINIMHTIISQAEVRTNRSARSQQLPSDNIPGSSIRQSFHQIDQVQSKPLCPNLKFCSRHNYIPPNVSAFSF